VLSNTCSNQDIIELSVSSWFYRNRSIAGFDNPARSLYVSIREIVENSLDACETAGALPHISVKLGSESTGTELGEITAGPQKFRLVVSDNGSGILRKNITKLIGKMLTGTKFTHKQSRGTFGLGGSLALLYGQVTTQEPILIETGMTGDTCRYRISMRLDIENNEPEVVEESQVPKNSSDHGTTISFHLQGDWLRSKRRILDYFEQTSVIVPYASIAFEEPDGTVHRYDRLIHTLPKSPEPAKPHPRGVDVEMLKAMISRTRAPNLESFLKRSFQRVGPTTAAKFLEYAELRGEVQVSELGTSDLVRIMNAFETYEGFMIPSSSALSPAGEEVLLAGMSRLSPEFRVVAERPAAVFEGHPFVIEVGVAYGGQLTSGCRLFRFANKIPLLYDEGSDVASRVIRELNLKPYNLKNEDPIAFFVHICSTKIPYKTVGKEYIADVDVVRREIELGLKDCLRRLSEQVGKKYRMHKRRKRENRLKSYYIFISDILGSAVAREVSIAEMFPEEDV
jgi:DNA topoisomerase-6 subunit B